MCYDTQFHFSWLTVAVNIIIITNSINFQLFVAHNLLLVLGY
jgi:hypothetical protein